MSVDYYLVCEEKKIIMPLFSMNMGGIGLSDKRYVFDFIMECGGCETKLLHEDATPDCDEQEKEWKFINAWHPYKETEESNP